MIKPGEKTDKLGHNEGYCSCKKQQNLKKIAMASLSTQAKIVMIESRFTHYSYLLLQYWKCRYDTVMALGSGR